MAAVDIFIFSGLGGQALWAHHEFRFHTLLFSCILGGWGGCLENASDRYPAPWCSNPLLVQAWHYWSLTKQIKWLWPEARVEVLALGDQQHRNAWADYEATAADMVRAAKTVGEKGLAQALAATSKLAEESTHNAATDGLDEVMRLVDELRPGPRTLFIGYSNGAIPAFEAAVQFEAAGLWLASGVVATEQRSYMQHLRCPVVVSAGDFETYFGGQASVLESAPSAAVPFCFPGYHAREPSWLTREIIEHLRNLIV